MDDSGEELRVVSVVNQEIRAKLLKVRKDVPFIRSVRESNENSLSQVQSQRLKALIGLLERDNVSMVTLNKIERIVNKLKTKFNPGFNNVIDISDQNSNELPSCSTSPAPSNSKNSKSSDDTTSKSVNAKPSEAPKATTSKSVNAKPSEAPKATPATKKTQGSKPSQGDTTKTCPAPAQGIPNPPAAVSPGGVLAAMQEARIKEIEMRSNAAPQFTRRPAPSAKETAQSAKPPVSPPQFTRRLPSAKVDKPAPLVQEASKDAHQPSPEKDIFSVSSSSTPSPAKSPVSANSLEEARKKLAALRGGTSATGQDQPAMALASNINDPRGKKHTLITALPKHDNNESSNNVKIVSPPPMVRILSPVPPAPSMKPNSSSWFTYANIPVGNVSKTSSGSSSFSTISQGEHSPMSSRSYGRDSGSDPRRSFNGNQEPRDPRENRDTRESWDHREGRSESRDPRREGHNRDPRMGRNQSSHGPQQQHQSHAPSYAADPRRGGPGTYSNIDEINHWQSTSNGNANANKYSKPNWGAKPSANANHIPVSGFTGSGRPRGGFRGGGHNPTMGRYGRPNAGPPACNGTSPEAGPPSHVPRTYREHKEAKARADAAAAKFKLAEELRLLEAEKQRLLEAVEKETQLDKSKEGAEAAALAGPASAPAPAGPAPEPQLDTFYRNSTVASAKKIDFRIPKKTQAVASSPMSSSGDGDGDLSGLGSGASSNNSPSIASDVGKDSDNNSHRSNINKVNDKDLEVTKTNEKTKGKDKKKSETKKHHQKGDQKGRSSSKEEKKRLDKDKSREDKDKKSSSSHDVLETETVVSVASSEDNENLENEPPVEEVRPASSINGQSPALSEETDEKVDAMVMPRGGKKIPTLVNGEVLENGVENNVVVDDIRGGEAPEEKAEPPKLTKIKIVLGPNAHSQLVLNETFATTTSDVKHKELFADKHDDTEVPAPPMQELRRIMKRRYSMVPKASQPLVDKAEILTGGSLLYEDLQEQKRQSQRARNLAHIFEKTSDNCRISTQNIITGKRRTRGGGGPEASFNETQLSRRSFGLGKYNRSRRSEVTKAAAPTATATEVSISEPAKVTALPDADVALSEPSKTTAPDAANVATSESSKLTAPAAANVASSEPSTSSEATSRKRRRTVTDVEDEADVVVVDADHQQLPQPPPTRRPRFKRGPKRNELEKLNEDIARMYNGHEVLRATGRRACTQRSRTPSMSRISPLPETNSSLSSRMSSPIVIRNVARRGKRFTGPSSLNGGLNRATFQAKTKKCVVKMRRVRSSERIAMESREKPLEEQAAAQGQEKKAVRPAKRQKICESISVELTDIRNVNPDWHATSAATLTCVICNVPIRKSPVLHYIQNHGEHYGARMPPGRLDELRAGRYQRPDYWIAHGTVHIYYYKCPFCEKVVNLRTLSLSEHLITHTGERRYQCSHCLLSLNRLHIMHDHIKTCGPGATVIKHANCGMLPISLHVCPFCEFVQVDGDHMDRHLITQHGLKEEELRDIERERVLLCTIQGVPRVKSLAEGQKIVERNQKNAIREATDPKPKGAAAAAGTPTKAKPKGAGKVSKKNSKGGDDDDEGPSTSKAAQKKAASKKVKFRFQKMAKKSLSRVKPEREDQTEDQTEVQKEDKQEEVLGKQEQISPEIEPTNMNRLPLPPPEKENLLVVNECLMDQHMETELDELEMELEELADEEQAWKKLEKEQSMLVEEKPLPIIKMDDNVDADTEKTANPEPLETEESVKATQESMEIDSNTNTAASQATKHNTLLSHDLSLSELDADLLDGIGSDASDVDVDVDDDFGANIDEWIDLETAERNRKAKNPFQSFTRFCTRLNKASRSGRSGTSNASSEDSHDSPDPSELMPRMRPLEPESAISTPIRTKEEVASPPQSSATAVSPSAPAAVVRKTPLKRIENVAYRTGAVGGMAGNCAAYYCIYPGCTFLFSNELEGLENHFAREHPTVRWTGTCAMCPRSRKCPDPQPHSIADELRHMTEDHMTRSGSLTYELMEVDPSPPEEHATTSEPPLFKLRVRRFTGDRLAEIQTAEESQPATAAAAAVTAAVATGGKDQPNGMLRGLLQAEPRPPNQVDFNAAGLGEFLCAKPTTPPQEPATSNGINATTTLSEQPAVINYASGLGLAISQVFTGASLPISVLDSPPLGPSIPAPAPAPAAVTVPVPVPVPNENHNRLVPDRFRCMAANCGFCAHTVLRIREHMKFHSFSFGSSGYLNCAYCNHVATDVDDYIRHGIVVHSLAPNSDLHGIAVETPSVSQQIRDMLNQRGSVTVRPVYTPNETAAAPSAAPSVSDPPPAMDNNAGTGAENGGPVGFGLADVSLASAIAELLRPTGYSEDKLYACPQKGCIVRLTEEQFVNHLRYHIRSTLNQGSEQVKCKYCTQTLLPPSLRTHLQQAHARHKIFCCICLATAANKRLMLHHVRTQHSQEFELINRHVQFIQLPTDPDAGGAKGGGTAAAALAADASSVYLAAAVQPFGKQEMVRFQRQLLEELLLRRQGTKKVYRGSEVRLLPRMALFSQPIRCAECNFSSNVRTIIQRHLYDHKESIVRETYQLEESSTEPAPEIEVDVVSVVENAAPNTIQVAAEALIAPPADRPPGQHNAVIPKFVYVPTDHRYRCGFTRCIRLLSTELELRQHMTVDHCYTEELFCHHCKLPLTGQTCVDKYLAHLMLHKRYIYQCGACTRYNNKRSTIERHIQERHPVHEVDVVVHRHSDTHLNTAARWLKSPRMSRLTQMEYICNLCQINLPTAVQIMAHAVAVHDRRYQYHCPYCSVGNKEASEVIDHILSSHPGQRVQPVQVFQQISYKKSQTLGFYCILCLKGASSCQRIGQHCEELHKSRFQWQCPHCEFGHQQERFVSQHLELTHPQRIGLAVMQFERVTNDMPDALSWELGQPIEQPESKPPEATEAVQPDQHAASHVSEGQALPQPQPQPEQEPKQTEPVVTEVVDLLTSDEEREDQEIGDSQEERKIVEFACTHCGETNSNLQDLRTQHWAHAHPDQPFYFRVQPQLLCSECKRFRSNAKTLHDDHLVKVHSIRNIVACDVRRPEECAYCEYKYHNWKDLAQHIGREGHLPNDLKNVTDDELAALQQLSSSGASDDAIEYYQCDLCSVVMPTKSAIAQHGRVEHSKPGERFCFRQLTTPLIYHCFFCMFTSAEELTTLRHMVDHYNRFLYCHFCAKHLPGGFDEYIQHCYTFHREDVHRFRELHSYVDLRKFLINVHYQFQNGLIITKSSLRRTRFNDEKMMRTLYEELMTKVRRPPLRLHINLKSVQGQQSVQGQLPVEGQLPMQRQQLVQRQQAGQGQQPVQRQRLVQGQQAGQGQVPSARSPVRITQRRKTLNPDELLRLFRQNQSPPPQPRLEQPRPSPSKVVKTRIITPSANRFRSGNVPAANAVAVDVASAVPSTSRPAVSATAPQMPSALGQMPAAQQPPPPRITQRRKTLNPNEMSTLSRQLEQPPAYVPRKRTITSLANPLMSGIEPVAAATATTTPIAPPALAPTAAVPAAVNVLRIVKRRNSYVVHTGP